MSGLDLLNIAARFPGDQKILLVLIASYVVMIEQREMVGKTLGRMQLRNALSQFHPSFKATFIER